MAVKMEMKVHPVADLFPMLPDDELRDLAEDIKIRGQLQPIALDKDGAILDGRNRFAACNLAGIEPQFVTYEGDDPDGYALAVNISRRHMTKGQQAIVVARALRDRKAKNLESKKRDSGMVAKACGISAAALSQANMIIEYVDSEGDRILAGTQFFDPAYKLAVEKKKELQAEADELAALRAEAPDLADRVHDQEITFEDAECELEKRREDACSARLVAAIDVLVAENGTRTFTDRVEAGDINWQEALDLALRWEKEFHEAVDRNVRRVNEVLGGGWKSIVRIFREPETTFNKLVIEKLPSRAPEVIEEIRADVIDLANKWEGK